ncbi:MAG TPA: GNAT family N-acetyltransferase [Sphingomicrobium sp.]|nr:GNAT family N-acetyltransferase [Sphingomicrobium sp.]
MAEVIAETERLILRTWRDEDRPVYLAACNTEAVTAHLNGPAGPEEIDAAFGRIASSQAENGFSFWAIERKSDAALLGYCGLRICDDLERPVYGQVEIGWCLREDAWGRGYALEAARACLEWAWANLDADRVVSFTIPANEPSWRLMERLGMERRADLDFAHPKFAPEHPLSRHITYVIERPVA